MSKPIRPSLQLYYNGELRDKDGKVIKRLRQHKSRSFTEALGNLIYGWFQMAGYGAGAMGETIHDTSGNAVTHVQCGQSGPVMQINDIANDNTYGIQWGTGTPTIAITDTTLGTLIAQGSSSGQLVYSACTISYSRTTSGITITIVRTATNNSGASITVSEQGLVGKCSTAQSYAGSLLLLAHDLISTPVTIPTTMSWTSRYIITIAFP